MLIVIAVLLFVLVLSTEVGQVLVGLLLQLALGAVLLLGALAIIGGR